MCRPKPSPKEPFTYALSERYQFANSACAHGSDEVDPHIAVGFDAGELGEILTRSATLRSSERPLEQVDHALGILADTTGRECPAVPKCRPRGTTHRRCRRVDRNRGCDFHRHGHRRTRGKQSTLHGSHDSPTRNLFKVRTHAAAGRVSHIVNRAVLASGFEAVARNGGEIVSCFWFGARPSMRGRNFEARVRAGSGHGMLAELHAERGQPRSTE